LFHLLLSYPFCSVPAFDWLSAGDGLEHHIGESGHHGESYAGSSSSDEGGSGREEEVTEICSGEEDEAPITAEEVASPNPEEDGPPPFPVDDDEFIDREVYAAAADTLARQMHSAAVTEGPEIYVPPESLYLKRLALLFYLKSLLFSK
jgi:hypothetical protein